MADVIPPPFANKMAHAVYPHLRSKLAEQKLKHQLKVVEQSDLTHRQAKKAVDQVNAGVLTMSAFVDALSLNGEAVREVELKQASTTSHNKPGTTMSETTSGGETPFSVGRLCNVTSKNFGLFSGFAENSHGSPIFS